MSKNSMVSFLCLLVSLGPAMLCRAQSTATGRVTDVNGQPVANANVLLLNSKDSSLVKGAVSIKDGTFTIADIIAGSYLFMASHVGLKTAYSDIIRFGNSEKIQLDALVLTENDGSLSGVTVSAKKPMFEQKIDRMVINVKNSIIDAGGTALEVLEKAPGVTVNKQSNDISVNGKTGVVVMINGKLSYMPSDALIQMLAGMNAGNIEKIELITTPPSKYDAEGNAGYINIVLINNPYSGFNGSYFLTIGYGKKELGSGGFNFNYRTGKINLYGNYAYTYSHYIQRATDFTQMTKSGDVTANTSHSDRDALRKVHSARIGFDFQLDSSTVIGALVNGYDNMWTMTAHNGAAVRINNALDTTIATVNEEINHWQNIMLNLNLQRKLGRGGTIYFDVNYIKFRDNNPNTYHNAFFDGKNNFLYEEDVRSGKVTPIRIKVFAIDYTTELGKKVTMETGAKMSLSRFTNDVSVDHFKQNLWLQDTTLSANYSLKEDISSAYASFTANVSDKTTVKAGLRYEYTVSNLGTTKEANIVDRKYGQLFPTFFVSRKINDDNSINFSYSRRITRPTFNDLAPFTIFFNPKTFYSGNPALQPALANAVQAGYTYKNYFFSISYTHEKNSIEGFQTTRIDTLANMLYLSARNFRYEQYLTAAVSVPVTITRWWNMQNNVDVNWREINTDYKETPVKLHIVYYNAGTTQKFILPKDFSVEATVLYTSTTYFGTAKTEPLYQVDFGVQKKFNNQKDVLRFAATDIFNSGAYYQFTDKIPIPGAVLRGTLNFGFVAFKLTYTHNFGNKNLKEKRDHSTNAENELQRVRQF